jgi:hypothetical protein
VPDDDVAVHDRNGPECHDRHIGQSGDRGSVPRHEITVGIRALRCAATCVFAPVLRTLTRWVQVEVMAQ